MLVSLEETIARAAEALPDRLGLRLAHRPDRLPLRLQPLDLRRRPPPNRWSRASASACLAERFLPREVGGPVVLAPLQIFLPPREEAIARARGIAPRPPSRGRACTGPMVFHSACSAWISAAVFTQSVESASASARSQSACLRARLAARSSFCAARCAAVRRKHLVLRRLEPPPHGLALRCAAPAPPASSAPAARASGDRRLRGPVRP